MGGRADQQEFIFKVRDRFGSLGVERKRDRDRET
jgi:hypothetical protein